MIVGTGVDLVDVPRFARTIARTPRLLTRLFAPGERPLAARSLAARYAAKEALIKALGGSDGVHWTEIEIVSDAEGKPGFALSGSTADVVAARGIGILHLTMSHDAGLAIAYVVAEAVIAESGVAEAVIAESVVAESGSQGSEDVTNLGSMARNHPNVVGSSEVCEPQAGRAPGASAAPAEGAGA